MRSDEGQLYFISMQGHNTADVLVLYGAAVVISCALNNGPTTPTHPTSLLLLLLSSGITITFFHFEISTGSNLLLPFLLLPPLIFSVPVLPLSQLFSCYVQPALPLRPTWLRPSPANAKIPESGFILGRAVQ